MQNKNELVKQYIKDNIDKQMYQVNQLIESEAMLCEKLHVSRMTVRKALDELVLEGVIFKEKGRGSFVAGKPKYADFRCGVGFTQEAIRRGFTPSSKHVSLNLVTADENIANSLMISVGDLVWNVCRVRCIDEQPVIYVCEYYNYAHCSDLTLSIAEHSIYQFLKEKGIVFAFVDQKIEAVGCPKEIADALELQIDHPVILMSLTAYMKNGIPFNCGFEYYDTKHLPLMQSVYNKELY